MVTSLLFGKSVVVAAKSTIETIQRFENRVYKFLIGVAGDVTIAVLRGEIGASRMESRIMESMLTTCTPVVRPYRTQYQIKVSKIYGFGNMVTESVCFGRFK